MEFLLVAVLFGLLMLVLDSFEVGRNDAANITNAVFGARVMTRRRAAMVAGVAVILGATCSKPVMETARKGIFSPNAVAGVETLADEGGGAPIAVDHRTPEEAGDGLRRLMTVYVSVYAVDTALLYGFSAFGMPVSTTAMLVFELVGASLFLGGSGVVSWGTVGKVVSGIVVSILISGILSFLFQRIVRGAIWDKARDRDRVLLHGPWIAGGMLTFLSWFIVFKGLKNLALVKALRAATFDVYDEWAVLLLMWAAFTLAVHIALTLSEGRLTRLLFPGTAVLGMLCLAFAFGQNDLANAASPGLAALAIYQGRDTVMDYSEGVVIERWWLLGCGALMALGMMTIYAQRVTRAAVNTGSQFDHVALYAPRWCQALASVFLRLRGHPQELAPPPATTDAGKKIHFDTLRASVIMAVSASVIAYASGHGLPVSTTYVTFAAILGTGFSDRVLQRGDSKLKVGRAIWVITCWFLAPLMAVVATGPIALLIYHLRTPGLALALALSIGTRLVVGRLSDRHERRWHRAAGTGDEDERATAVAPA